MALLHIAEIEHDLADVGAALRAVTVAVQTRGSRSGQGSGILWDAGGTIVTNAHVVHGGAARVTLADGRAMEARAIAWDPRRDLAVLRIDRAESAGVPLPVARVGDPSRLRAGELVRIALSEVALLLNLDLTTAAKMARKAIERDGVRITFDSDS